ncbi:MAG: hypothetical protein KFB93_03580 [Simkaniaceae bacterium]|nr:MAG: hypothetical protein KFB93_03580 [Simkaniaceae bacterium]
MAAVSDVLCNSIANDFMRGINPQMRAQNTNTKIKTIILSMKVFLGEELLQEVTRTTHFEQYPTKGEENLLEENLRQRKAEVREMVQEAPDPFDSIQLIFILMVGSNVKFQENKTYANLNYTVTREE